MNTNNKAALSRKKHVLLLQETTLNSQTSPVTARGSTSKGGNLLRPDYQLVHVMNEVWYSDAFAPKFVLRKVFSIARSQLLVGE